MPPSLSHSQHAAPRAVSQTVKRAVHRAKLLSIHSVAPAHYQIRLEAPELAQTVLPGQFVHVCTKPNSDGFAIDPLLRRAFSVMSVGTSVSTSVGTGVGANAEDFTPKTIDVLFRVEGRGTQSLARARAGDEIDLIGPLGQPFDLSPFKQAPLSERVKSTEPAKEEVFHVKQPTPAAIVVGGGVGVPPLVYLSQHLATLHVDVEAIIGARTATDIIGQSELSEVCHCVSVTTDDGSRGHHGRVTDLLAPLLKKAGRGEAPVVPVVYACGPLPMLRAVAQLCALNQVRCQVSLEENMPCGIGVCNGCVVRASQAYAEQRGASQDAGAAEDDTNRVLGSEWSPYRAYRRVCVEGPACWSDEIDWDH